MSETGEDGSATQFCAACHSVAKVSNYVLGSPMITSAAMSFSSVSVISNALRLRRLAL